MSIDDGNINRFGEEIQIIEYLEGTGVSLLFMPMRISPYSRSNCYASTLIDRYTSAQVQRMSDIPKCSSELLLKRVAPKLPRHIRAGNLSKHFE